MKNNILYLLILVLGTFVNSCDDSFLEENKKQIDGYALDVPLFVHPVSEFTEITIEIPEFKDTDYKVIHFPKIIHFESLNGKIGSDGIIRMRIKVDNFDTSISKTAQNLGNILLKIGDSKVLQINVYYENYGNPVLELNQTSYDFAGSRSEVSLIISNKGTGYLIMNISDFPSWLKIQPNAYYETDVNGFIVVPQNSFVEYKLSVNREGLTPGNYEGEIKIISNDINQIFHTIPVKMVVRENMNSDNVVPLKGVVVDCDFDKSTNTLYVASSVENKVYVFDMALQKITKEISLTKKVNNVSLSETNSKLFVGQNGLISVYNTADLSLISQIDVDFMASDVIDGENGYYYIVKKDGDFQTYFYTYKVATEELFPSGRYIDRVEGNFLLKLIKVPYIFTVRADTSPNGLTLADIKNGKPVYLRYWHQSFGTKLWQKDDGSIVVGQLGMIFKTPNINTADPINLLGILKPDNRPDNYEYGYPYKWIDLNTQTKSIWGVFYDSMDFYNKKPTVIEWDENSLNVKRTVPIDDYYTEINGKKDFYGTVPYYIFSTREGNKIVLVKDVLNPDNSYNAPNINAWHLEIVDVTK